MSLNPSYTGIWLRGELSSDDGKPNLVICLNPSYTGIWLRGSTPGFLQKWGKLTS